MQELQALITMASNASDEPTIVSILKDIPQHTLVDGLAIAPEDLHPTIVRLLVQIGDANLCAQSLPYVNDAQRDQLIYAILKADDPVVLVQVYADAPHRLKPAINTAIQGFIPDVDKRLLLAARDTIAQAPELWDQRSWHGLKTHCFAGIVEGLAYEEWHESEHTSERAREALGLTHEYANLIFHTPRNLQDVDVLVDAFIGLNFHDSDTLPRQTI